MQTKVKEEKQAKTAQPETQTTEQKAEDQAPKPDDSESQQAAAQKSDNSESQQDAPQTSDTSEPQQDAPKENDESAPQGPGSPIAITAVREWMAQRTFNEKLTAVMLWQLARIEHVFEGPDGKIGNDIYDNFSADVLGETDVPADSELIRGLYAAWQIMPV